MAGGASLLIAAALFWLSAPERADPAVVAELKGDPARGARIFAAGGCASCHAAPGAEGEARRVLAGGKRFESPFGAFIAPNISPHEAGIGGWSALDLVNAMNHGVSPDGAHYYPAFPYVSYAGARVAEIVDLKAYLDTLPPDPTESRPHEVGFPFSIRRGLGLWKALYMDDPGEIVERGRYLAEALGHCAECHTPRDALGGMDRSRWMAGAPTPDGKHRVPNITPHADGIGGWSEGDIAYYLETGFRPDYDVAGGEMAEVVQNMAELPPEDRAAIAGYLKALAPLPSAE